MHAVLVLCVYANALITHYSRHGDLGRHGQLMKRSTSSIHVDAYCFIAVVGPNGDCSAKFGVSVMR